MKKRRLYLCQTNNKFGDSVYLPYSVGALWAYARTIPEVAEKVELCGFIYLKESIAQAVTRLDRPEILAISTYIWNWAWSREFATAVKEKWPGCRVLVGGVMVPDEDPTFLEQHPMFDLAIYGEGEIAFSDLLRGANYKHVGNLIYRDASGVRVNPRAPLANLDELPSPYLSGVFDDLLPEQPKWQVVQETHRGCPYSCTFCEWGQASQKEIRKFPDARILAEYHWFGRNKMEYLENADANYGLFKRDIALTRALAVTKETYGYPKTFRAAFAKNSNEAIFEISTILHGAGQLKAVTLAMQSMDDNVLVNIKRKNIKVEKFRELVTRYSEAGIPTYTELILGLADETLDQYMAGVDELIEAGHHWGIFTYMNVMLPNTEQNSPEYREKFGLETRPLYAMLLHATPEPDAVRERQETIVGTKAMPHEDWKYAWTFARVVELFHCMGILQATAIAAREIGLSYRDFYCDLINWATRKPHTVAGKAIQIMRIARDCALDGQPWDLVDPRFGPTSWPPEEYAFLHIALAEPGRFVKEIKTDFLGMDLPVLEPLRPEGDLVEWARKTVWFGRKGTTLQRKAP